eukprot:732403-Amorphochlora_amoeboformis.AAC.1
MGFACECPNTERGRFEIASKKLLVEKTQRDTCPSRCQEKIERGPNFCIRGFDSVRAKVKVRANETRACRDVRRKSSEVPIFALEG